MLVFPLSLLSLLTLSSSRECEPSDFLYEYTTCGESGERWRVAVPRTPVLGCSGNIPPPQKGLNCSFTCGPGNYLDLDTQTCRTCNPGTYSLGGGIRFDEFTRLPAGFSDLVMNSATADTSLACPEESGWVVRNTELLYVPSPCVSKLSFSANLIRAGYVEYTYRLPTNSRGLSLSVVVKNEQCQSYRDDVRNLLSGLGSRPQAHREENTGDWQKKRVDLRTGSNVISWTVTNSREMGVATQPIVMARIDVVGIAFTRQCTACPAGTYAGIGAEECKPCAAGSFSTKGSSVCGSCPLSQYSGPKSAHCYDRPPCRQNDYYPVTEPCVNGKTKTTFKKVLPAVCNENAPGAAKLPADEPERACPKCNPGMGMNVNGLCEFCAQGSYSDGNSCQKCAPNTLPSYGYHYTWWNVLPPHVETRCEFVADDALTACDIGDAWLPSGDAIVSSPSLQRGIAFELSITVEEGFHNPLVPLDVFSSSSNPVASITIVFDTKCVDDRCAFYFIEEVLPNTPKSFFRFLGAFNGTQPRRVLTHQITRRIATRFMVAFLRSGSTSGDDSIADQARIFSINVTNVGKKDGKQGGGAASCTPCAIGAGGCSACDPGKYLDETSHSCVTCPPHTFSNMSSSRVGVSSCITCGPNLDSDGTQCTTTGKIRVQRAENTTREYDITALKAKTFLLSGVRVFAREGTSYYHQLNMSLFGGSATCSDTWDPTTESFESRAPEPIQGAACRLTALPITLKNHTQSLAFVAPVLIGSSLMAITESPSFGPWNLSDSSLGYTADLAARPLDLHLFYDGPKQSSDVCPNGTALAVTLRCDPNEKKIEMKLPASCPDGTCDGCLYQAILESSVACPLCGRGDYKIIKGECINGKQIIHSIPQKHCVVSGVEGTERTAECSILTDNLRLLIAFGLMLFVMLLIILCLVFRRNQKLEYKYMKLVESKAGYELAGAESCALDEDEDEEDEDRVIFSKAKKGKSLFSRLRGGGQTNSSADDGDRINFASIENDED